MAYCLVFGASVVATALLTPTLRSIDLTPGLDCVADDDARNPTDRAGAEKQTWRSFETIEKAEAFICVSIPHPRTTEGWAVHLVEVGRSHGLSHFEAGEFSSADGGWKQVHLRYVHESQPLAPLELRIAPTDGRYGALSQPTTCVAAPEPSIPMTVQGATVSLYRGFTIEGDPYLGGCWEWKRLQFYASVEWYGNLDLEPDVVRLLESIE